MKTFKEVFDEIKGSSSGSGRQVKSFSRADFDELMTAYLNTPEYEAEVAKIKEGNMVTEKIKPVAAFRGMLKEVIKSFGVDEQEAAGILETYKFKESQGRALYDLFAELMYQYMEAGKKFDLLTKKDFKGGIIMEDVAASTASYKTPRTGEIGEVKKENHKKIKAKSKVPKWLKKSLKSK